MGYWGMIVAAPVDDLVHTAGIERFGYRHMFVRDLGAGWQSLETGGEEPDLAEVVPGLADTASGPVFAAYVFNGDCAEVGLGLPGQPASVFHLSPVGSACQVYDHHPSIRSRPLDQAVDEGLAWARAAGLTPRPANVRWILDYDYEAMIAAGQEPAYRGAEDLVFDLLLAFGLPQIGRVRPRAYELVDTEPFRAVSTYVTGLADQARAAQRNGDPLPSWGRLAIMLDEEIWAAVHDPGVDLLDLAARAIDLEGVVGGATPDPADVQATVARLQPDIRAAATYSATGYENEMANQHAVGPTVAGDRPGV